MFILYCAGLEAQTNKYWISYFPYTIGSFDSSTKIDAYPLNLFSKVVQGGGSTFSLSSNNGDLMFIGSQRRIFDKFGNPIINSNKLFIPPLSFAVQSSQNSWDIVGGYYYDTGYVKGPYGEIKDLKNNYCYYNNCFDSISYYSFGIYQTILQRKPISNQGFVAKKMMQITSSGIPNRMFFTDLKRIRNYDYCVVGVRPSEPLGGYKNRTLGLYYFDYFNHKLVVNDSMIISSFNFLPDSMKFRAQVIGHQINIVKFNINRIRNKAFAHFIITFPDNKIGLGYIKEVLLEINIDPISKKFGNVYNILFETSKTALQYQMAPNSVFSSYFLDAGSISHAFSTNDSIYYINHSETEISNRAVTQIKSQLLAWKYLSEPFLNAKPIFEFTEPNTYNKSLFDPNINPYGGVTIVYLDLIDKSRNFIHYPNSNDPFQKAKSIQKFSISDPSLGEFSNPILNNYEYIKIQKSKIIYKDCGAYFSIKNNTDTSFGVTKFIWYISKDSTWSTWDSFATRDLALQHYKKPGKYLIKLHGISTNGNGYEEYYIDTLDLEIPTLTVFKFGTKDTMICKNSIVAFNNPSYSKDTLYNKFLWHFGDVATSNLKSPMHQYTQPGLYSVSLFYSNGYCDSTIVKNQYIRVIDAPIAGFSVNIRSGCAPLSITIRDTVTVNVMKKDYYFSDSNKWESVNIFNPSISHTFNIPGRFYALQKLSGYTGCIIQTDSVFIDVSKGITKYDTLNILNSTVSNGKALVLWKSNPAAVLYEVFKDGFSYIQTKDTFVTESQPYIKQVSYRAKAIDSCGNSSIIGLEGAPIFLQGAIIGFNDYSKLNFTIYKDWGPGEIIYKVQKYINGTWVTMRSGNLNDDYIDPLFLLKGEVSACYRIEAYRPGNPLYFTHSNEVCLPYMPAVFIPNAFSPNNDGNNEVFVPVVYGIKSFKLTVINRWGEVIFKGNENEGWNGSNSPQGVYTVLINYITNEDKNLNQRVNVTLLK